MTTSETIQNPRNQTLDILRGLAIFTMILSNFAGEMLRAPHPFYLRLVGSLAAPLFVIIAGFLIGHSVLNKSYPLSYFLLRGLLIWVMAAVIDVFLWASYPFISVDILYLTGFAMPLTALYMRGNISIKILVIFLIFALSIFLKNMIGYLEKPSFPPIWKDGKFISFEGDIVIILKHWIIDGWFPIFPWVGVAFLGGFFSEIRNKYNTLSVRNFGFIFLIGLFFLGIGILFWNQEFRYETRGNYTELFYPPTLSYFALYLGLIFFLYIIVEFNSILKIYTPLRLLGVSPLFFYFFHFLLISKFIAPYFGKVGEKEVYLDTQTFFVTFFLLILLCLFIALLILLFKRRFPRPPFLVKFFIGG